MKISRYWSLAVIPFALAACGGDDAEMDEAPEVVVEEPAPAPEPAGMAGTGTTVALMGVGGAGASGEAMLTPMGNETQVMVRLTGAQPGSHAGHIHQGTCSNIGSVVVPLQNVTVAADGSGTSTSTVSVPPMDVMNGQHLVAFHEAGGSPGAPVACANIPMHQM